MKVAVFDTHKFDRQAFDQANEKFGHELVFYDARLGPDTAKLASGFSVVCGFVNDHFDAETLGLLKKTGTRLIALRSAGFNHVNMPEAVKLGIRVVRVPAYSPHAVAEHAVALVMALNRHICRASLRVREMNFSLEGLVGFDLYQKTVGVVGTGKIGAVFAQIMRGFGCKVLAFDLVENGELQRAGVEYVSLDELYRRSDVISLHLPLTETSQHLIDGKALEKMKTGVMLINTGRGALVDTKALVNSLKSGKVGSAGLDVYEEEENIFFQDLSEQVLQDDVLARLLTFPNVLVTSHQAFLTREALVNIASTTLQNISDFDSGNALVNEVKPAVN